jgi:hypothetical protein
MPHFVAAVNWWCCIFCFALSKPKKPTSKGTVTGHYKNFIQKTMDEMDCIPEMKRYYIVMDNAPI